MKNIPEKLQGYGQYKQIKHAMKTIMYESTNVDEFLSSWKISSVHLIWVTMFGWLPYLKNDNVGCHVFLRISFRQGCQQHKGTRAWTPFFMAISIQWPHSNNLYINMTMYYKKSTIRMWIRLCFVEHRYSLHVLV